MNKIVILSSFLILSTCMNANAQTDSTLFQTAILKEDSCAHITLFTAKYFEGKTWLHWNVAEQKADGHYFVLKSTDGKSFSLLGIKRGIGVPIQTPIAYYLQDESPIQGVSFYKVWHISENRTYLMSDVVTVNVPPSIPRNIVPEEQAG